MKKRILAGKDSANIKLLISSWIHISVGRILARWQELHFLNEQEFNNIEQSKVHVNIFGLKMFWNCIAKRMKNLFTHQSCKN